MRLKAVATITVIALATVAGGVSASGGVHHSRVYIEYADDINFQNVTGYYFQECDGSFRWEGNPGVYDRVILDEECPH